MEKEIKQYEKYRDNLKFFLVYAGLWPNYEGHPLFVRVFFALWSFFVSTTISASVLLFCLQATNMGMAARGLGAFVSYISVVLKIFIMKLHRKKVQSLNDGVSEIFHKDLKIPEYRPHLLKHISSFTKMFYVFDYFIVINLLLFALIPLSMARHGKFTRMFPLVIPFSYEPGGALHWAIYAFELVFAYYLWTVTCGVDSYLGLYALHFVGELKLLTVKFKALKTSENYRNDLKEIVDKHSMLIRAQHVLEEIFGFLVLWLAVTCAVILCMVIFQTSLITEWTALKIGTLITWSGLKIIQAYAYAWYGNIIAEGNKECCDAIWDAQWGGCGDLRFMNDIIIILSQKPLVFQAKSLLFLDFNMFSKIINTSVSYFFLLQTLEEKNLEP